MKAKILIIAIVAAWIALPGCSAKKSTTTTTAKVETTSHVDQSALVPGEWTIATVNGKTVTGDERPYLTLEQSTGRFYGNNGCNTINGDFTLGKNGQISFSNVIATMRSCPDAPFQHAINVALDQAVTYSIADKGHETYLTLKNSHGTPLMVIRKHNMDFLNGTWQVTRVGSQTIDPNENPEMRLVIDVTELRVHGNTGCNLLNGSLLIDPDKSNAVQFHDIATTRRGCDKPQLETSFLLALESVDAAKQSGKDHVDLLDEDGQRVITLKRVVETK